MGSTIANAPSGENASLDGTEKVALSGSQWAALDTIKAWLKTYFDTLYQALTASVAPADAKYVTSAANGTLSAEVVIPGLESSPDISGSAGAGTSEEYSTTTPGLTWAPSAPTTADSHTTIPSHLFLDWPADTTERLGTKLWAPAGAFDARCKVIIAQNSYVSSGVVGTIGLMVSDSGHNNRALISVSYNFNTQVTTVNSFTYASSAWTQRGSSFSVPGPALPIYLRMVRDGSNNITWYWSMNGILWVFIATYSFTLTVANLGFRGFGNATAGYQVAVDWLRTSV